MLKTKEIEAKGHKFVIGSLSVRQFGAMMDARKKLYGDAMTIEAIMAKNIPAIDMSLMEAEFIVMPSLNNGAKQNNAGTLKTWTLDEIIDGMDQETFRAIVDEIFKFIGVKIETKDAARGPIPVGENQAANTLSLA